MVSFTEKVNVTVSKKWQNDNNNEDGNRPTSITYVLYKKVNNSVEEINEKKVEVKKDGSWPDATWENLPKKSAGQVITYLVKEKNVQFYEPSLSENEDGSGNFKYTMTNTYHRPETSVKVNKVWEDDNNRDGKRPAKITVTVKEVSQNSYWYIFISNFIPLRISICPLQGYLNFIWTITILIVFIVPNFLNGNFFNLFRVCISYCTFISILTFIICYITI